MLDANAAEVLSTLRLTERGILTGSSTLKKENVLRAIAIDEFDGKIVLRID
jgi:hypothetical protein